MAVKIDVASLSPTSLDEALTVALAVARRCRAEMLPPCVFDLIAEYKRRAYHRKTQKAPRLHVGSTLLD